MVLLFGANQDISKAIIDLLPQQIPVHAMELQEDKPFEVDNHSKQLQAARLIFINFDSVYNKGLQVLATIQQINPKVAIIALDSHESNTFAQHLMNKGASAYLPITSTKETFHHCFQQCLLESQQR